MSQRLMNDYEILLPRTCLEHPGKHGSQARGRGGETLKSVEVVGSVGVIAMGAVSLWE